MVCSRYFRLCSSVTGLAVFCGWIITSTTRVSADLAASWEFEERVIDETATGSNSILDSSGNGLHGTPFGGPVYRSVGGSTALEFDGIDDYIFIADNPRFELTHSLSLEATIRLDALTGSPQRIIFRGDDRPGLEPYEINIRADGRLRFAIRDELNTQVGVHSPTALPVGELLHVVGTFDGDTGQMKLFVNQQLVDSRTTDIRPFGELDPTLNPGIGIGSRQTGVANFFDGIIDGARIHNSAIAVPEPSGLFTLVVPAVGLLLMSCRRFAKK